MDPKDALLEEDIPTEEAPFRMDLLGVKEQQEGLAGFRLGGTGGRSDGQLQQQSKINLSLKKILSTGASPANYTPMQPLAASNPILEYPQGKYSFAKSKAFVSKSRHKKASEMKKLCKYSNNQTDTCTETIIYDGIPKLTGADSVMTSPPVRSPDNNSSLANISLTKSYIKLGSQGQNALKGTFNQPFSPSGQHSRTHSTLQQSSTPNPHQTHATAPAPQPALAISSSLSKSRLYWYPTLPSTYGQVEDPPQKRWESKPARLLTQSLNFSSPLVGQMPSDVASRFTQGGKSVLAHSPLWMTPSYGKVEGRAPEASKELVRSKELLRSHLRSSSTPALSSSGQLGRLPPAKLRVERIGKKGGGQVLFTDINWSKEKDRTFGADYCRERSSFTDSDTLHSSMQAHRLYRMVESMRALGRLPSQPLSLHREGMEGKDTALSKVGRTGWPHVSSLPYWM